MIKNIKKILNKIKNKFNYFFFPENLLTRKPIGNKEVYKKIFEESKNIKNQEIENILKENQIKINLDWFDQLALHTQVVIKKSKINYYHGKLLYSYLSKYLINNQESNINILETGTARGYSSICMSKALIESDRKGRIFTIDILPNDKKMYWNCIDDHTSRKTRIELLNNWKEELVNINFVTGSTKKSLNKIKLDRIHFAFLDAAHTYEDVMYEFNYVSKLQKKSDIIFFDDVTPNLFDGVTKAINHIKEKKEYNFKLIKATEERGYAIGTKI